MQKFVKFNDVAESYILIVDYNILLPISWCSLPMTNLKDVGKTFLRFTLSEKLWPAYLKLWPEMYEKEALGKTRDLSSVKKLFSPVF